MAADQQLSLFDRDEEARAYHDPEQAGFFSILVNAKGDKRQSSHRLIDMPTVLGLIDKNRDTWMTQAEFIRPNRRVVNLARVGLLFAELDTYRKPWASGRTPEQLVDSVLYHCTQEGMPPPQYWFSQAVAYKPNGFSKGRCQDRHYPGGTLASVTLSTDWHTLEPTAKRKMPVACCVLYRPLTRKAGKSAELSTFRTS